MVGAFSEDLRWRAVFLFWTLEKRSLRQIGELLRMAHATVKNILDQYARTGSVSTSQGARGAPANQIFTVTEKWRLLDMMLESDDDDMFIEVQRRYFLATGVFPSLATFTRAVRSLGFTRKRVCSDANPHGPRTRRANPLTSSTAASGRA
jgi:transposase